MGQKPISFVREVSQKKLYTYKCFCFFECKKPTSTDSNTNLKPVNQASRQVISLSIAPELMKTAPSCFSNDAIQRATEILGSVGGNSMGKFLIDLVLMNLPAYY